MDKTVVIFGSRSIKSITIDFAAKLDKIMELGLEVLVGDAYGVDRLVLEYLAHFGYEKVQVFYCTKRPRVKTGYPTYYIEGSYTDRDRFMCDRADYGLALWDGKSRGTLRNIKQLNQYKLRCRTLMRYSSPAMMLLPSK